MQVSYDKYKVLHATFVKSIILYVSGSDRNINDASW